MSKCIFYFLETAELSLSHGSVIGHGNANTFFRCLYINVKDFPLFNFICFFTFSHLGDLFVFIYAVHKCDECWIVSPPSMQPVFNFLMSVLECVTRDHFSYLYIKEWTRMFKMSLFVDVFLSVSCLLVF